MSWSESWDLIKQLIWQREAIWKFGYNTTPNIITEIGDTMTKLVSNIATKQVNDEVDTIVSSLSSMRASISQAIDDLKAGIDSSFLTLAPVMEYPSENYNAEMIDWLRRYMTEGIAKTGTNWTFTNGNTTVTCSDGNGSATSEFSVGQMCYLEGDDPYDVISNGVTISSITNDNEIVLSAGYPGTGGSGTIRRIETVKARNFTRGSVTAYTNNEGDGTILRTNTDEYGFENEVGIAGTVKFECVLDPLTGGIENQSTFKVFMEGEIAQDKLNNPTALKDSTTLKTLTSDDNTIDTYNTDFSQDDGAAANNTKIPGWYVSDHSKFTGYSENSTGDPPSAFTYVYKKKRGTITETNTGGTGYSLQVQATAGSDLTAKKEISISRLRKDVPYIIRAMVKGESGVSGNARIEIQDSAGNVLKAGSNVALSTSWQAVELTAWLKNFTASPIRIVLVRTDPGAAVMYWSNFVFAPYQKGINGCWIVAFQGQSDFLTANQTDKKPDGFYVTDTGGTSGIIQYHHQALYGRSLPNADTPTIADPT